MESTAKQPLPRLNFFRRVLDNPVVAKEFKGRMRGRQGFIMLTVYLLLISFFVTMIYFTLYSEGSITNSPDYLQTVGKALFGTVVLLELLMVSFIAPALTSGAISSERERRTFDLLHISLLSPRSLVFGKLGSAIIYLLLLIFTAIPVESLAFFLGGVGLAEISISTLMLVVTAVFYCTLGIFFSSLTNRTLVSTVLTYGSNVLSFVFFFVMLFMLGVFGSSISRYNPSAGDVIITMAMWFFFSTNSFFAAIISEVILIDSQSIFITNNGGSLFGSGANSIPLLSPWIIYVIFYSLLTVVLILLSIYFVGRTER